MPYFLWFVNSFPNELFLIEKSGEQIIREEMTARLPEPKAERKMRHKAIEILNAASRDTGPTGVVHSNWAVPTTIVRRMALAVNAEEVRLLVRLSS